MVGCTPANGVAASAAAAAAAKVLNHQFSSSATTIFEVMSKLAREHQSVNLGQGFPDDEGPESMKRIAADALFQFSNQYPPMIGVPELREAVARHSRVHSGLELDPASQVLVTVGATEGIAVCLMGLCNPGDEVITFEPLYDSYAGMAQQVGAKLVPVPLQPPNWSIPADALAAAFTPRTKLLILNSPHNPTGKVFTRAELELVAGLLEQHNAYALLDEVYQHLVYPAAEAPAAAAAAAAADADAAAASSRDGAEGAGSSGSTGDAVPHVSLATLPGMARRCLRVGSAGKTFSFTGWKIGWLTGPAALLAPCIKAHQFVVFTVAGSLQRAVAHGLDHEQGFYTGLGAVLARKRALLEPRVRAMGFNVLPAQGTYFLVADAAPFMRPDEDDATFCQRLTIEGGVTLIPVSAFYSGMSATPPPRSLVRFCFCKDDTKLAEACDRLEAYLKIKP